MQKLVAVLFLGLALSGCFGDSEPDAVVEPLPEPADGNQTANITLPPAHVKGVVLGPDGPIQGAEVYVETVDLTVFENNIAEYVAIKNETLQVATDGTFNFTWNDTYQRIAVRAPGMTPWSSDNLTVPANASLVLPVVMKSLPETLVTAHRGGALYAPDNTLSALHKAGLLGIPRAEIDIHWTQDEVFVLWHDGVVEDQTGERMWMRTSDDVTKQEVGSAYHESFAGETIPTLDEALEVMRSYGTVPVIEVKISDDPRHAVLMEAAIAAVKDAGYASEAVVISFDPSYDIQCGAGGLLCGYIEAYPEGQRTDPAGAGKDVMADFITEHHMPKELATPDYVAESQAAGNLVTAWTVNDVQEALDLVANGVDAITTDMPWEILQALSEADL